MSEWVCSRWGCYREAVVTHRQKWSWGIYVQKHFCELHDPRRRAKGYVSREQML